MYIRKLILLLFLTPVFAAAQKTTGPNYTYIAQRYEWLAGVFKALGLPAGDSAQFQAGQEMRAGAVYYDSVGVDSGLYVWSGLSWNKQAATAGANTALSNLASVAINTSLISDADNTDDLGSSSIGWKDVYSRTLKLDGSISGTMTLQPAASVGTNTITLPAFTGTVLLGSQTAGRIPFAINSVTLTDDAGLTWDNGDKELLIGGGANVGAFPVQVHKTGNSAISIHNGTQFTNILTGSSLSIFQFPVAGKFGIQAATTITDNGSTGLYPLIAFGSGNSHSVLIGGVAFSVTPNAKLDVRGDIEATSKITLAEIAAPSTPSSGKTVIYPKSDGLWYGKDDAGVEKKLSNSTLTKNINLPTPGSAENEFVFFTPVAITVTNTRAVLVGSSTPSVTYNIAFGTDRTSLTNVYTAGQTVTSTTTGTDASGVNDATIPANSWVILTTSAQSGTVTAINASIQFTED